MRRLMTGVLAAGVSVLFLAAPAAAAAAATADGLPRGFLKYESEQARKPFGKAEISWRVSDKRTEVATLDLCGARASLLSQAESVRSVLADGDADYHYREQVAVFADDQAATGAMAKLRKAVRGCAKVKTSAGSTAYRGQKLPIGDEALQVSRYNLKSENAYGERSVVVRRGSAVIVYAEVSLYTSNKPKASDFRSQVRDAKAMAVKVCDLPGVC
ncbi:hypothetical protein ABZ297_31110 [Nonomuraea sp. NPDC005983]|uniref:hypothetical protein n=1 Tax=Nonomuraea sp. NPDC005983 TaxID=3155595 RepID=UPI0033A752A7